MITELTPEQEARLPEFRDKWLQIGLSTEPANRPEAERGINLAYECAGLRPPKEIIWCDSPLSIAMAHHVIRKSMPVGDSVRVSVGDSVRVSVGASVRASVGDSVRGSVGASVGVSVGASVWASVWASVGDSVGVSVRDGVRDGVWASVGDSVRDSVRDSVWALIYGSHDAHWLGFYDYFNQVCGLTNETKALVGLWLQAQHAGWWMPYKEVCFVSERHNILKQDTQGRLHCEDGLAIGYPDGWGVYAWHGVRVPERVIMHPDTLTGQDIIEERNVEVRRVMMERMGDRLFKGKGASQSDEYGKLYRWNFEDDESLVMVQVNDASTERQYFLRVPPHIQTAHEAVAWTFDVDVNEYTPAMQT